MKSFVPKDPGSLRDWWVIDATDQPLGRVAVRISNILRGRNKPIFAHHVDTGDFVIVVNAEKIRLSGRKNDQKTYVRYSGYRSGLKSIPASVMRKTHPDRMIRLAVRGMLPKNRLARSMFSRLKVYAGGEHPHAAQQPKPLENV